MFVHLGSNCRRGGGGGEWQWWSKAMVEWKSDSNHNILVLKGAAPAI
jgi:hypothetical protein